MYTQEALVAQLAEIQRYGRIMMMIKMMMMMIFLDSFNDLHIVDIFLLFFLILVPNSTADQTKPVHILYIYCSFILRFLHFPFLMTCVKDMCQIHFTQQTICASTYILNEMRTMIGRMKNNIPCTLASKSNSMRNRTQKW